MASTFPSKPLNSTRARAYAYLAAYTLNCDGLDVKESATIDTLVKALCRSQQERTRMISELKAFGPSLTYHQAREKFACVLDDETTLSFVWYCITLDGRVTGGEEIVFDQVCKEYPTLPHKDVLGLQSEAAGIEMDKVFKPIAVPPPPPSQSAPAQSRRKSTVKPPPPPIQQPSPQPSRRPQSRSGGNSRKKWSDVQIAIAVLVGWLLLAFLVVSVDECTSDTSGNSNSSLFSDTSSHKDSDDAFRTEYDNTDFQRLVDEYVSKMDVLDSELEDMGSPEDYVLNYDGDDIRSDAYRRYDDINSRAYNIYDEINDSAYAVYSRITDDAYAKYSDDEFTYDEYNEIRSDARRQYDDLHKSIRKRYDSFHSQARKWYDDVYSEARNHKNQ